MIREEYEAYEMQIEILTDKLIEEGIRDYIRWYNEYYSYKFNIDDLYNLYKKGIPKNDK